MKPPVYDKLAPDYEKAIGWLERRFFRGLRERALAQVPPEARVLEKNGPKRFNIPLPRAAAKQGRGQGEGNVSYRISGPV